MKYVIFVIIIVSVYPAYAQFQQGGVDHPGDWYVGEGLAQGDLFSYKLCHVDYKECSDFVISIWFKGDLQVGTETKWLTNVVVYDGNNVIKGNMELGKIAPEPTGGDSILSVYRGAFKSSIVWLSAFANSNDAKKFDAPSWGKIGNIGGEQILPKKIIQGGVTTRGGHFDDVVMVGWRTGGANSEIYIADGFPFPVKASTWTHVSEGIPPQEYNFELLEYEQNAVDPFADIENTAVPLDTIGCPNHETLASSVKKPTNHFNYQVHVLYGPEFPVDGCPMTWQIKFISKYDDTEFLNEVQYDLIVVDDIDNIDRSNLKRSIAQEEGRDFLFSPSGQALLDMTVKEGHGTADYVVWIYGLSPKHIVPSEEIDFLHVPIEISPRSGEPYIPSWIKTTVSYWVDDLVGDDDFTNAIQFLIKQGIIDIPSVPQENDTSGIPAWIKTTAGYWVESQATDGDFINALQFLIKEGILVV